MLRWWQKASKSFLAGMPISTQSRRFASRLSQKLSQRFSFVSCATVCRLSTSDLLPTTAGVTPKTGHPIERAGLAVGFGMALECAISELVPKPLSKNEKASQRRQWPLVYRVPVADHPRKSECIPSFDRRGDTVIVFVFL